MQKLILKFAGFSIGVSASAVAGGCANSSFVAERVVEKVIVVVVESRSRPQQGTIVRSVPVVAPTMAPPPEKDHEGIILKRGTLNEKPLSLEARP